MDNSVFHRLAHVLWIFLVTIIVILAVYVSFGRLLFANISGYHTQILWELNQRSIVEIDADSVAGDWRSFSPVLVLGGVRLMPREGGGESLALGEGRLTIDVWRSLLTRSLQFVALDLDGLTLQAEVDDSGSFRLRGFEPGGGGLGPWLEEMLLNMESLSLSGVALEMYLPADIQREFDLNLSLQREGSDRWLEAALLSTTGTSIDVRAQGQGNPFSPQEFSGLLYLDFDVLALEQIRSLLPQGLRRVEADGALDLDLWFGWDRGQLRSEATLMADSLTLRESEGAWTLPLDQLSLKTKLQRGKNRWTFFAENLVLEQGEVRFELPRLQLDTWGDSLRLRASELPLRPANELFIGSESLPQNLRDVFGVLNLDGQISQLELNVADLSSPADEWQLLANFDQLAVDSWRGAPGVRSASGHVTLAPGGGTVILDSQRFSMDFPTVYREPLYYDDFYGSINVGWDEHAVFLSSGPVIARGVEGEAQALFGLNIPLEPTDEGIEMELLVGLVDSYPIYRTKYLPYILPQTLQDWLRGSIGEGRIEEGAFLWRGSLRRGAQALRTIQLFFNVADTRLEYHPDWPAASSVHGTVLIDDLDVSVWADQARLLGSQVERLSVEAWPAEDKQIMLAVRGEVEGDAADGLAAVNESPLSALAGDAFADWGASGGLHTSLDLLLNLSRPGVPEHVDVVTRWRDVQLDINPGGLQLETVNGRFLYNSEQGFSAEDLGGKFWGRPISVAVIQGRAEGPVALVSLPLQIRLAGVAAVGNVQDWLGLDALAFAAGETAVDVTVDLRAGQQPLLLIDSQLYGVALDLPAPWGKVAEDARALHMETFLGRELGPLRFRLGEDLALDLLAREGDFLGGSLAFRSDSVEIQPGRLRLTGHTPLLGAEEWLDFVGTYFSADPLAALSEEGAGLAVSLESLRADEVRFMGGSWNDVTLDLEIAEGDLQAALVTDWLEGALSLPAEGVGRLDIGYLEIDGLGLGGAEGSDPDVALEDASEGNGEIPRLPDLQVGIHDLRKGGRPLGQLSFELYSGPGQLLAENISGNLAGLRLLEERPGRFEWRAVDQGQLSDMEAPLVFDDLGDTLQVFGYEKSLETASGRADLTLNWPGGPQDFELDTASGQMLLAAERGRFLNTDAGTSGALRIISVLNMADLLSRLSLNQVFESGVPFHSMGGALSASAGKFVVDDFEVLGSSSSFQLNAVAEAATETIDGELVVTLPLASNLPWVAALAAASWPVAAGVFVVGKVFEEQFNRLSSGVYDVSGTWSDPQLVLTRAFDNTSSAPQTEGEVGSDESTEDAGAIEESPAPPEAQASGDSSS